MGRFVGLSINKGSGGGGGASLVEEFDRSSGITTDSSNDVTSVTLGDLQYSNILYNTDNVGVGLITSFTETSGGVSKNYEIAYTANYDVNTITEIL